MSTLRDFFPPVAPASQPFMQVQDQKLTGTPGGANVAGDNHRVLNTVMYNDIVGASLASNQVILPVGAYYIEVIVPTMRTVGRAFIADNTDVELLTGLSHYAHPTSGSMILSPVNGKLTFSVPTTIKVISYCHNVVATFGLGYTSQDISAPYELYTDLRIWQIKAGV